MKNKWTYLWSAVINDLSQYKPFRCYNGGCYAFQYQYLYFYRYNNGNLEFRRFKRAWSSADFDFTDYGRFVTRTCEVKITNVNIVLYFTDEYYDGISLRAKLEKYSEPCTAREVLYAKGDEPLSIRQRAERYKILKSIGVRDDDLFNLRRKRNKVLI